MYRYLQSCRITIAVAVLAVLAWAIPIVSAAMEIDFHLINNGQWWRIWTGHLTHYDFDHLFWDLLMFVVLGTICERTDPRRFPLKLIAIMTGVTIAVVVFCDGIVIYRGLSGVDTGLFVWFVIAQSRRCWIDRQRATAMLWSGALLALLGKLTFEATTGQTLFVDASGFAPLVESHLAGAGFGIGCYAMPIKTPKD